MNHVFKPFGVLPTTVRQDVDPRYTGKGVTIAMIDSGFAPHPDLLLPRNRVVAFHDPSGETPTLEPGTDWWRWHGTMTTVVAAGSGHVSGGRFPGIASDANLVLVKASYQGRILEENVEKALEWVIYHQREHNIRVVNISLGAGDELVGLEFSRNRVNVLAERAVEMGMTVCVAAGNSLERTVPPACAPSVISVGGHQDDNFDQDATELYHSAYGLTADAMLKPEVIAPADMVAVPILTQTPQFDEAAALFELSETPSDQVVARARLLWQKAGLPEWIVGCQPDEVYREVEKGLRGGKFIGYNFQHGEGTSFASPIVASIVAQMLEANPALQPHVIKNLLVSTADRLLNAEAMRQGYGMVNARRAVEYAVRSNLPQGRGTFLAPSVAQGQLVFWFNSDQAQSVALAGDFNGWSHQPMERQGPNVWRLALPLPSPGRYTYKFLVDGSQWVEDPSNGHREPDPYGGLNSVVTIEKAPPTVATAGAHRARRSTLADWMDMADRNAAPPSVQPQNA